MDLLDFQKYIESIGFVLIVNGIYLECYYFYNNKIELYKLLDNYYYFYDGYEWICSNKLNDLTPLMKMSRNYKIKII